MEPTVIATSLLLSIGVGVAGAYAILSITFVSMARSIKSLEDRPVISIDGER